MALFGIILLGALFSQAVRCQIRSFGAQMCTQEPTRGGAPISWPPETKIRVECPPDYEFVPDGNDSPFEEAITCQNDGNWNYFLGSCQRVGPLCDRPATPSNGKVEVQSPPITEDPNKFTIGSHITYACNRDFIMSGESQLSCTADGTWSPFEPPRCIRPTPPPPVITTRCYMPRIPVNGDIRSQSAPIDDGTGLSFVPQSDITYRCNPGYSMQGEPTITCNPSGRWNRRPPTCTADSSGVGAGNGRCYPPPDPRNGRVVYTYPAGQPSEYRPGGRIRYACYRGFRMIGSSPTITCSFNGEWVPTRPDCSR